MGLKVVTFACNHSRLGGDNMSMLGAIEGLQKNGITSTVIIPEKGDIEVKLKELCVKYILIDCKINYNTSKFRIIYKLIEIIYNIILFRSDIIHSNDVFCNKYMTIAGKILKIPTVCHVRYFIDCIQLNYYMNPPPNFIIFNSKFMESEFFKLFPRFKFNGNTSVVYNPISAQNYFKPHLREDVRTEWNSRFNFIVCIVGNISENKGHLDFVEIANKLLKFRNDFRFVVVGEDISNDKKHLKAVLELVDKYDLNDDFIFHGVDADMGKVFSGIDLLLFPSHFESFGRVVVESLLARVPVVASRVGGLIEILEGNPAARLVELEDINNFVESTLELRKEKESKGQDFISIGKDLIINKFSFRTSVNDLINIYKAIYDE